MRRRILPPNEANCDKCKAFIGTYYLNGTDHNMGFLCAKCYPLKEVRKFVMPADAEEVT